VRCFCDFCADFNSQPTSALREKILRGVLVTFACTSIAFARALRAKKCFSGVFATLPIFEQLLRERFARKIFCRCLVTFRGL